MEWQGLCTLYIVSRKQISENDNDKEAWVPAWLAGCLPG